LSWHFWDISGMLYIEKDKKGGGNMLKRLSLVLMAVLFIVSSLATYAAAGEVMDKMGEKFHRGLVNTFTGWIEIPLQIRNGYNQGFRANVDNKLAGVATGAAEGFFSAAGRTATGLVDLFGFWAVSPASNEGVGLHTEAEDPWEDGEIYDLMSPTVQEATIEPISEKLKRGIANTLFGIAEVPGQIKKGMEEGSVLSGTLKGFWYFLSREISGLQDLVTLVFPTPKGAVGNNFVEEWPWSALSE